MSHQSYEAKVNCPPKPGVIADLVRQMLVALGENPEREGLRKTPERFERALCYLTSGYRQDPARVLNGAVFEVPYDQIVVVRDIEVFSLCEHHLLPFFGSCHVGYIPRRRVIGLSKIARLVNLFARRLQLQERLTRQIAEALNEQIQPEGVAVVVEAQHLCMMMRGVEKRNSRAVTSTMLGVFRTHQETREEFLALIRSPRASR